MSIKISGYNTFREENTTLTGKTLPNAFSDYESGFWKYFVASVILHPAALFALWLIFFILTLLGVHFPLANKPELKTKDIEFVLTQNEAEPINKNTKYRSDKNSRAGGIHDPNRPVSMPTPSPSPAPVPKSAPAASKPSKPVQKSVQKPVQNQVQKPVKQAEVQKAPVKPSKPLAPSQKPVLKPSTSTPKPQMPKLAAAPSSPFKVEVPKTSAPVGKGFSAAGGTSSTGGSANGTLASSGMPAPQFSTARTASSGYGSSSSSGTTGRGGYGTGNMGNPGPGNPSGAPGIDAIKSPQWGPYMRELESKIKRNWHPPKGNESKRVVLIFKIGKRGELLSVRVSKSSGAQDNDNAAISAVQMSAPFRALPAEYTGSSVEIEFTFDYNVLGASYR
ncbi:MAG: TonB family protein [Candidatus Gastranaerophilales bacterium]|nr:TonB family protein [Candidatus Gastranaerophilales bacterium]